MPSDQWHNRPICRFCDDFAVGLFEMSDGCVCFPEDREQWLCMQHALKATPLGSMRCIASAAWARWFVEKQPELMGRRCQRPATPSRWMYGSSFSLRLALLGPLDD